MSRRHEFFGQPVTGISETLKINVIERLDQFVADETQTVLKFEPNLSSNERKYIHQYCAKRTALKTQSIGVEPNRYLTITKKSEVVASIGQNLELSRESQQKVIDLRNRLSAINPKYLSEEFGRFSGITESRFMCRSGRLSDTRTQPTKYKVPSIESYPQFRRQLPIFELRDQIVDTICRHQIVVISGDTGCGKTTQVPQYLLEHWAQTGQTCRIVCAEPRRLAAISVAERIAAERNEQLGKTVGYQIRLESKVSAETALTFCTNGIILRTLMSNREEFLKNCTHLIIDEVHERDRFCDFLLLILKQYLTINKNLRLILMSATFNTNAFVKYFSDDNFAPPILQIPGRQHPVDEYFLEDILKTTDYMTLDMARYQQQLDRQKRMRQQTDGQTGPPQPLRKEALPQDVKQKSDSLLKDCWVRGSDESFDTLLETVSVDSRLINYKNSETGVTPLICAVAHNKRSVVEALICFNADPNITAGNGWTALDCALNFGHQDLADYLSGVTQGKPVVKEEEQHLLELYHHCFNDDDIDSNLICALIAHIMKHSGPEGAVLVFLPGMDDINSVRDAITSDTRRLDPKKYEIFVLHSQIQSSDQKRVFEKSRPGVRKIILSTNIAETSVTIDDVVFVIDSGKVKELSFDSLMGLTSLRSVWVSQSSVKQRLGRAGRTQPGVCYHLFSRNRYQSFAKHQLPEILRIPIHELCLQTKLLVPKSDISIQEFLSQAMDPPSAASVRTSVQLLKTIDALDSDEGLTQLGLRLLDLPVEPNFGKMILHSIVLRCVEPVLTIVSSLAYRDPFMLSSIESKQKSLKQIRKHFAQNEHSMSDHLVFLSAYNQWSSLDPNQRWQFCRQYQISNSTMEVIDGIRRQLLQQLESAGFVRRNCDDHNDNADHWPTVKAALCAGAYPKLVKQNETTGQLRSRKDKIKIHSTSTIWTPDSNRDNPFHSKKSPNMGSKWFIYEEMIQMGRHSYAKCMTAVSPLTVALVCAKPSDNEITMPASDGEDLNLDSAAKLKIDEWIDFETIAMTAKVVSFLRDQLHRLFNRQIHNLCSKSVRPPLDSETDNQLIDTIVSVLDREELHTGFAQFHELVLRPQLQQRVNQFVPKYQSNQYFSGRLYRNERRKFKPKPQFGQRFN